MIPKYLQVLTFIFLISLASASYSVGNSSHQLTTSYNSNANINGWINLSLTDEPSDSLFTDSFGNSISLINLIKTQSNYYFDYNCSTVDCTSIFSTDGAGQTTKTFFLAKDSSKIIGFKLSYGDVEGINSIKLNMDSSAPSSCLNQFEIDIRDDNSTDIVNSKALNLTCFSKNYGCFKPTASLTELPVDNSPFCQRVNLTKSPGFFVGAWLKKETGVGTEKIKFELRTLTGTALAGASCSISPESISTTGAEATCNFDKPVTQQGEYYVCMYKEGSAGTYKTRGYVGTDTCGFRGLPQRTEVAAYQIFAIGKTFGAIDSLNITNTLPGTETFSQLVMQYLQKKYNYHCTNGCVVPIKITSKIDQTITLRNLAVEYIVSGFGTPTESNFYDLIKTAPKIDADFQKLYLDEGNFSVPSSFGNQTFELKFNDNNLISQQILVERFPEIQGISPTTTAVIYPTTFQVISSAENITKYQWNFGDNKTETTTSDKVTHSYNAIGAYNLNITITDASGLSASKIFIVTATSPQDAINKTIIEKTATLRIIEKEIETMPAFYKSSMNSFLGIKQLGDSLADLQRRFLQSSTDEQYIAIITEVLAVKIPSTIFSVQKVEAIPSIINKANIDLALLSKITDEDYDQSRTSEYFDSIVGWNIDNLQTKITSEQFSVNYDSGDEIITFFKLDIKNSDESTEPYLVLRKMADLSFEKNESEEEAGYVFLKLTQQQNQIQFFTTEDVDFSELNYFISPSIGELTLSEAFVSPTKKTFQWSLFILVVLLLLIIGIIVYIVLQQWYKTKYENSLFKNKNHLYNLVTYIENSKKKGMKNDEIETKLKKTGWGSEQVDYVMKKYAGKRTGMVELPIGKILDKFKFTPKKEPPKANTYKRLP